MSNRFRGIVFHNSILSVLGLCREHLTVYFCRSSYADNQLNPHLGHEKAHPPDGALYEIP